MLDLVRTRDEDGVIGYLGPDVLADDFPESGITVGIERLRARPARPLAESLLDQRGVAGLGTIWVAESCWERGVWPWAPVGDVDLAPLLRTAHRLMARSVAASTDVPRHAHGRMRKACRRCGTPIAAGRAGRPPQDRPIFYCPGCQRP
jgi:endonuclease-8